MNAGLGMKDCFDLVLVGMVVTCGHSRTIQVRLQRSDPQRKVVVFYKAERMGVARMVDFTANDRPPAKNR